MKILSYVDASFLAKLYKYARWRIRGAKNQVRGRSYEDYVHEAIEGVMDGRRSVPDWVVDSETALRYMTSVVSSIISNSFVSKEVVEPAIPLDVVKELSVPSLVEVQLIDYEESIEADIIIASLRKELLAKPNALKCLDAYQDIDLSNSGGQVNKLLATKTNMSVADVVAAKKQIERALIKIRDTK